MSLRGQCRHFAETSDRCGSICSLVVPASDEIARQWYLHWEFEPSGSDPLHHLLLMKDTKSLAGKK
jgi:hypothetical protein